MIKLEIDGEEYTEEEFQRDLRRYFDTLEETVHCHPCKLSEDCEKCMFFKHSVCGRQYVRAVPINYSFDIIERVYRWAKEHPVMTNRRKLKEVFGINVINSVVVDCDKGVSSHAYHFSNIKDKSITLNPISKEDEAFGDWLGEEYKEPKEESEE